MHHRNRFTIAMMALSAALPVPAQAASANTVAQLQQDAEATGNTARVYRGVAKPSKSKRPDAGTIHAREDAINAGVERALDLAGIQNPVKPDPVERAKIFKLAGLDNR